MAKQTLPLLCSVAILLFSCSSIKLNGEATNLKQNVTISNVRLVAVNDTENAAHDGIKIGEFVLKEDLKNDWKSMKRKMVEFAKQHNANFIEINTIGWAKKGHGFYADGTLYYVEKNTQTLPDDGSCHIYVRRNSADSPVVLTSLVDIKINEQPYNNLSKKDIIKKDFTDCYQKVVIAVNGKSEEIQLSGRSKYYHISKETSGYVGVGTVAIGFGDVSLIEITDAELGRLIMYQSE